MGNRGFWQELKRRHVYRVAVAYAVVGWLLIQVATQVFPVFHLPDWIDAPGGLAVDVERHDRGRRIRRIAQTVSSPTVLRRAPLQPLRCTICAWVLGLISLPNRQAYTWVISAPRNRINAL